MEKRANRRWNTGFSSISVLTYHTTRRHFIEYSRLHNGRREDRTSLSCFHCHVVSLCKQPAILFKYSGPRHFFPSLPFAPFQAFSLPTRFFSIPLSFLFPFSHAILLSLYPSAAIQIFYRESRLLPSQRWLECSFSNPVDAADIRNKIMQTGNNTY